MIRKPNPSLAGEGLGNNKDDTGRRPYSPASQPSKPNVIKAELLGDHTCSTDGLTSCGTSPVLHLCRLMLAAGHDPTLPLRVYRGHHLALAVASIAQAAALEVNSKGTAFVSYRGVRAASRVRQNGRRVV